jgi:hypothetical protein
LFRLRRWDAEYSAVRAIAVGITPPRPSPPSSRNSPKSSALGASAQPAMASENQLTLISITFRRPTASVATPATSAPTSIPTRA